MVTTQSERVSDFKKISTSQKKPGTCKSASFSTCDSSGLPHDAVFVKGGGAGVGGGCENKIGSQWNFLQILVEDIVWCWQ